MRSAFDRLAASSVSNSNVGDASSSASDIPAVETPSKKRARLPSGGSEVHDNPSKRVKRSGKLPTSKPVVEEVEPVKEEYVSHSHDESIAEAVSVTTEEDDSDDKDDDYKSAADQGESEHDGGDDEEE